jgi:signal transduction histidine kinase
MCKRIQTYSAVKKRRHKEQRKYYRLEMLEKVIRLGKVVTEAADYQTVLLRIWSGVRSELGFDRLGLYIYDASQNAMRGCFGTNQNGQIIDEQHLFYPLQDNGFFSKVLSQPDGFFFSKNFGAELNYPPNDELSQVKYHAAVSAWAGDKPVAVICVDQLISGRTITTEQLEALRLFAGYAGLAIENARLNQSERTRQEMLEKVIRLGKLVTEVADYRMVLFRIWNGMRNELGFDRVGIFTYDASRGTARGSYGTDRQGNLTEEWQLEVPAWSIDFFGGMLNQPDGFYFTTDYEKDRNLPPEDMMSGVKYYVAASAWAGEKPVALLCADQLISGRTINEEQVEALRFLAGYAGLALKNADLNQELEKRVAERTTQLEVANKELEAFSYSVSHDLRAPLRSINGFAKILGEDFSHELSPMAGSFLGKIIDSGEQMTQLIDELLDFSRLGRKPLNIQPVDVNELVQAVIESLAPETAGRQIEWIRTGLPATEADPALLRLVYANLLGNAVKYTARRETARIEVGSFVQDGEAVYFVRDNGAGFDMQYADKLFGVFQRLHREDEFEGTGIGLATVQRIINRHGGRIWAEAEVDKGATFYFTLGRE